MIIHLKPHHILLWEKIDTFRRANGYSPTLEEMEKDAGISKSSVVKTLSELEYLGCIKRHKRFVRSVETVKHPKDAIIQQPTI